MIVSLDISFKFQVPLERSLHEINMDRFIATFPQCLAVSSKITSNEGKQGKLLLKGLK